MRAAGLLLLFVLWPGLSPAEEADDEDERPPRFLLGASLLNAPEYAGAARNQSKIRPLWAYQHGRFRISTSRAGGLLGLGGEAIGSGASADLLRGSRFKLGLALRTDGGRSSGDSARLKGLPEVRRTLRGRLYAGYALSKPWSLSASLSHDLLGREGGTTAGLDLGYRARLSARSEWSAGIGLGLGDARYMRSYHGIDAQGAAASGLPSFRPGGGLRDLHLGLGLTTVLDAHWVGFATLGASTLLGDAADSPLTQRQAGVSVSVGLAYRWGNRAGSSS
jgi:MipA family protein